MHILISQPLVWRLIPFLKLWIDLMPVLRLANYCNLCTMKFIFSIYFCIYHKIRVKRLIVDLLSEQFPLNTGSILEWSIAFTALYCTLLLLPVFIKTIPLALSRHSCGLAPLPAGIWPPCDSDFISTKLTSYS